MRCTRLNRTRAKEILKKSCAASAARRKPRDLEHIRELSLIDLLVSLLLERVGQILSVQSLRETLQVAHESVGRWLTALENMYLVFLVPPYTAKKIRAVKKEKKLYF